MKWLTILKNATVTTLLALIIAGPIVYFELDEYGLQFEGKRTLILLACLFVFKILFDLIRTSTYLHQKWQAWLPFLKPKVQVKTITTPNRILALIFLGALVLPFFLSKYWLSVAILSLIYILLGLGLNIVVGLAGLLNLGFAAFYAVGAYTFALGAQYFGIGFWVALPFAALLSALFGALLGFPVLKMYGDYLAIVTLGFGEIIRLVLNNWDSLTGGPNGMSVPLPTFFGLQFTSTARNGGTTFHEFFHLEYDSLYRYLFVYFILFLTVCLVLRLVSRLQRMPMGRAWEALREDEIACRSLGINHVTTKLSAFSLGAMVAGIAGVFFAATEGFVNPASFTFIESALILSIVVLGGMGSVKGVVLAAIILTLLPEMLREFSEYRMLIFGAMMVLMMMWRPKGLIRLTRQYFTPRANE
jgi:branched-chain amino acid transport system permease protein